MSVSHEIWSALFQNVSFTLICLLRLDGNNGFLLFMGNAVGIVLRGFRLDVVDIAPGQISGGDSLMTAGRNQGKSSGLIRTSRRVPPDSSSLVSVTGATQ